MCVQPGLLPQLSSPSAMVNMEQCPCTGGPGVSLGLPGEQLSHCLDPLSRLMPLRLPSVERDSLPVAPQAHLNLAALKFSTQHRSFCLHRQQGTLPGQPWELLWDCWSAGRPQALGGPGWPTGCSSWRKLPFSHNELKNAVEFP